MEKGEKKLFPAKKEMLQNVFIKKKNTPQKISTTALEYLHPQILFVVSQPGFTSSWKGYNPNKATRSRELGNYRVCKTLAVRSEVWDEVKKNQGARTGKPLEFEEQGAKGQG